MSSRDARRIALAAQGFARPRPTRRIDRRHFRRVLGQVATVQLDSVNVLTRSHELVFFARLGAYSREALTRWLWSSGEVFEYWGHEASVHPVARHGLLRWRMSSDHSWGGIRNVAAQNPEMIETIRRAVLHEGPLTIGQLEAINGDGRRGETWWGWSRTKRGVEYLFWKGEVAATRRSGFERIYLAPESWLPAEILHAPTPGKDEAQRALLLEAAQAIGVGTARDLADYFRMPVADATACLNHLVADGELVPARVDGWRQPAYIRPDIRPPSRSLRARALLSPFDSLIWQRQRTERLWGFRYRIEIYVPKAKRVHGYYVLPFLLGETLVGRVDLKADRRHGVLRVRAAWCEPTTDSAAQADRIAHELAISLAEMADWLSLRNGIDIEPRGTLAPQLASAVASHAS
jgi:uncharacterized protein YcaQ